MKWTNEMDDQMEIYLLPTKKDGMDNGWNGSNRWNRWNGWNG